MKRLIQVVGALGVILVSSSLAAAQTPPAPAAGQRGGGTPAPRNLKVLPMDIPGPQLVAMMGTFTAGLGVECGYCHVYVGRGNPGNNLGSDEKPTKTVARMMIQMTNEINAKLAANIQKPADQLTKVQCATCHRGSAVPVNPPPPTPPAAPAAAPAR